MMIDLRTSGPASSAVRADAKQSARARRLFQRQRAAQADAAERIASLRIARLVPRWLARG